MNNMLLQVTISALIVIILGLFVGHLIRMLTENSTPRPPASIPTELWREIIGRGPSARHLGLLERFFYLAAFWLEAPILIAGWLAFKVASGWHAWSLILQLPKELEGVDQLDYLRARSQLSSWIFHRFLIGTLANILISLIAVLFTRLI
jgi:hypothetical protein